MRHDIATIKAALLDDLSRLVEHLAPGGTVQGKYYLARNPTRADRNAGSFWVWMAGPKKGGWCDAATGDKGDVIGLIAYCRQIDTAAAIRFAEQWCAGRLPDTPEAARRAAARREADEAARRAAERDERERRGRSAFALWLKCSPGIIGTPVDTYLASRGIRLADLRRRPSALRYAADLEHRPSGTRTPAMVACMVTPGGAVVAVHRTYLAPGGHGKAAVTPNKMMLGNAAGAVIRLARGKGGLTPEQAARAGLVTGPLALAEGIEDALTICMACPELRVWAVGSLGNLARVRLPRCASHIIVAADNDWTKPQAMAGFDRAVAELRSQGKPVHVARSWLGKDVNDLLRGAHHEERDTDGRGGAGAHAGGGKALPLPDRAPDRRSGNEAGANAPASCGD